MPGARRMSSNRILKEMAPARVAQPPGRRATARGPGRHGDLPLSPDRVYRTMGFPGGGLTDAIRGQSHAAARELHDGPVSVIFPGTTTPCFGRAVEDGPRARGYGRDGRHRRVQAVLALPVTPTASRRATGRSRAAATRATP